VIVAIVCAKGEAEALEKAKKIFDDLVERSPFDYYTTFDEDRPVSGKSRWGNLPVVALADSEEGKKLIEEAMQAQWEEFKHRIGQVRAVLQEFSDEEIFEGEPSQAKAVEYKLRGEVPAVHLASYYLYSCYRGLAGPNVWLYNPNGRPIEDRGELRRILEGCPHEDLRLFVVPADVHF